MILTYQNFWPLILICSFLIVSFYLFYKKQANIFIKEHWGLRASKANKVAMVLEVTALLLLFFISFDIKKSNEKVETKVLEQKTLLLIDVSPSMFVEDIKPSRFNRALFIARHFVKKTVGHSIALFVFSDSTQRVSPFTSDKNFLDAKISNLIGYKSNLGGSSITVAIKEVEQYFLEQNSYGNILLLTDLEEHEDYKKITLDKSINLAILSLGTTKGGPIPTFGENGKIKSYVKYGGETVISQYNAKNLQKFKEIKNFKHWKLDSYSIPTEDVLSFFNTKTKESQSKKNIDYSPSLNPYFLVLFFIIMLLTFFLKISKKFYFSFFLFFITTSTYANKTIEDYHTQALKHVETRDLQEAEKIFSDIYKTTKEKTDYFNFNTVKLLRGNIKGFFKNIENEKELRKEYKHNLLWYLKNRSQQNQDSNNSQDGEDGESSESQNQDQKNQQQEQSDSEKQPENQDQEEGQEGEEEQNKDSGKDQENKKNQQEQKQEEAKEFSELNKVLQELQQSDNQLQQTQIQTFDRQKGQGKYGKKNW